MNQYPPYPHQQGTVYVRKPYLRAIPVTIERKSEPGQPERKRVKGITRYQTLRDLADMDYTHAELFGRRRIKYDCDVPGLFETTCDEVTAAVTRNASHSPNIVLAMDETALTLNSQFYDWRLAAEKLLSQPKKDRDPEDINHLNHCRDAYCRTVMSCLKPAVV